MILISVFAGVVYLFMTAGFFAGRWVLPLGSVDPPMLLVISLLLVYALALVGFALRFRKSDASRKEPNDTGVSMPPESGDLYRVKAGEYGLTEREEEVLLLMLKGRNLPFISEKLVISKNTVRSHFKSIYRKCGVHSKQELLDLFEAELLDKTC